MAFTPWMTSDDLIESIKRKISFPVYQTTFSDQDILDFATEELMISQVPSVMQFHEEFFVTTRDVTLKPNKTKYPIPDRAIGMKLRDLFYKDTNGNLFEMTRIAEDDKAFFQRNMGTYQTISKYYLEGNDIVLSPDGVQSPTGSLCFVYFLRPNRLVPNERAAIINCFTKTLTIDNTTLVAGDTFTINDVVFTAVSGSPSTNEFQIGGTSIVTATNLVSAITISGVITSANNGSPSTAIITLCYSDLENTTFSTTNSDAFEIQVGQGIQFDSIPSNITNGSIIDLLQTKPGHKIRDYDITLGSNAISGNIINFDEGVIPSDMVIGDYICSQNECIIPGIPPDLHTALAERTCARILSAIGDTQGLASTNEKIAEIEQRQGTLLDNRVEGSIKKVRSRHSLLSLGKMSYRRRW